MRVARPDIATACDLARVLTGPVRDRRGRLLATWVREAETNGPGRGLGCAGFLHQDWDAVLAGMAGEGDRASPPDTDVTSRP
ncbi:hypothetical protein AB0D59_20830 [Streptomyces sp. NPDC048417]|uniref:hypothetical protein n=1 Tax=Streptomyces sp. NPDC048417 TaxID=3155387 RepID=UPI003447D166